MTPPSNGHSTGPSVGPLVGVLALQGDVREHRVMLERAGARTIAVRRPEEVERVDGGPWPDDVWMRKELHMDRAR